MQHIPISVAADHRSALASENMIPTAGGNRTSGSKRKVMERARLVALERDLQRRLTVASRLFKSARHNPEDLPSGS